MFGLGLPELLLILVIGLIFFGPGKAPANCRKSALLWARA